MPTGAVGAARTNARDRKLLLLARAQEDSLTFQLIPPILADRLLLERLIDHDARRNLYAVRADGRAEDELPASPAERANSRLRLLRLVADHVHHHVEAFIRKPPLERSQIIAIADDLLHIPRQPVLALPAVEHRDLRAALLKVLDDAGAD